MKKIILTREKFQKLLPLFMGTINETALRDALDSNKEIPLIEGELSILNWDNAETHLLDTEPGSFEEKVAFRNLIQVAGTQNNDGLVERLVDAFTYLDLKDHEDELILLVRKVAPLL